MKVSLSGVISRIAPKLRGRLTGSVNYGYVLEQFLKHLEEAAARYYAGEPAVADELFQLYAIGEKARADAKAAINRGPYVLMKGGFFFRPKAKGYTAIFAQAGRYTEAEAREYYMGSHGEVTMHLVSIFENPDELLLAGAAEVERLKVALSASERNLEKAIEERDQCEDAITRVCVAAGVNVEWSSAYDYDDAVSEVREVRLRRRRAGPCRCLRARPPRRPPCATVGAPSCPRFCGGCWKSTKCRHM